MHEEIRLQSSAPSPSGSFSQDEKEDKKLRCDLTTPKPLILVNGATEWGENGCSSKLSSRDQEYCHHAVRNAFRSNPVIASSEKSGKKKSLKNRFKESISRVSTSASSFSDVEGLSGFLTMPELKKKRQTSVALLRKTRTKHPPQLARLHIFNPAFAIDSEVNDNMAEKDVKGNKKTAGFHRKLSRNKSNDFPRNQIAVRKVCDLNEQFPNEVKKTSETSADEAPLAEIRCEVISDVDLSSGEYIYRNKPEENGTSNQGGVSDCSIEIRPEPSLIQQDAAYDITEMRQQESKVHGEVRGRGEYFLNIFAHKYSSAPRRFFSFHLMVYFISV